MEAQERNSQKVAAPTSLTQALLVLSGVGVASAGYVGTVGAQPPPSPTEAVSAGPIVSITAVKVPKNVLVKTPKTWQRVEIELTEQQKLQLSKAGVQTDKLRITTYNIKNLAADMIN